MTTGLRFFAAYSLCGLLACCPATFAKESAAEKARPLLKAAATRALFNAEKTTPFALLFKFELRLPNSKPASGAYSWLMTPEGDWRKETKFLDYSDLEIGRGTTLWVKRTMDARPLPAGWIDAAFSNFMFVDRADDEIARYSTASDHHVQRRCVDLFRNKTVRTLCFDPEDNLQSVELKDSHTTFEYSDFRPVGKKFAPYKIAAKREGQIVFDGTIENLSSELTKLAPSLLAPPSDALKRAGCLSPSLPVLKNKVFPSYPLPARTEHRQGTVTAYVLVASDGTIQNPTIIQTGGQDLDASVLSAVRKWQYEPAKCGANPVDFEQEITVNFTLEYR